MADTITKTEQAVLPAVPPLPQISLKMTAEEICKQVQTYMSNADASLTKLQQSIEKQTENLGQLQRMQLMVQAQREMALDLYNKIVGSGEPAKA